MTNPEKILKYLSFTHRGEWVMEGTIRGIDTEWGWIGFRGDRDVRQLVKDGKLDAAMRGKFRVVRAKENTNEAIIYGIKVPIFKQQPIEKTNQLI